MEDQTKVCRWFTEKKGEEKENKSCTENMSQITAFFKSRKTTSRHTECCAAV